MDRYILTIEKGKPVLTPHQAGAALEKGIVYFYIDWPFTKPNPLSKWVTLKECGMVVFLEEKDFCGDRSEMSDGLNDHIHIKNYYKLKGNNHEEISS